MRLNHTKYTSNNKAPKEIQELKTHRTEGRKKNNLILIVGDFNTPLSTNDRHRQNQQKWRRLVKVGADSH